MCTCITKKTHIWMDEPKKPAKNAFAGSRTRVYCLEGNYPNRWTTNACALQLIHI